MSRKDTIITLNLKKDGEFDLDLLYSDLHAFFEENSYIFHEKENTQKSKDKGSDIEIKWESERTIDNYGKIIVNVNFIIERAKKIGKTYTGDLTIVIEGSALLDYKEEWLQKPLGKALFGIYNRHIIKKKIEQKYYTPLFIEVNDLQDRAKRILDFYP